MPPSVVENFVVGIVTSVVTAIAVWVWGKIRNSQIINRRAAFFGISPAGNCLVVINHNPRSPNTMSHRDVEILVEVVRLMYEIGGKLIIAPSDQISEPAGAMTEFCIGGPGSNKRTGVHMDNFLKGINMNSYASGDPDSLAITTKQEKFRYENDENEYAILARFHPHPDSYPVILFCGQTSRANQGAAHYLIQNYDKILRNKFGNKKPFCFVVRLQSPSTYGYKSVKLVKDVTETAFTP